MTSRPGMPNTILLGVGELGAHCGEGGIVKTLALGSCVAIIIMDRQTHCVAMSHVALPESTISPSKAKERPGHFADTAVVALMREMQRVAGKISPPRGLIVKLAGGANVADPNNTFNIGKRNVLALKKELWKHGLGAIAEDVGANFSRTVTVFRDTGRVCIHCPGRGEWEI